MAFLCLLVFIFDIEGHLLNYWPNLDNIYTAGIPSVLHLPYEGNILPTSNVFTLVSALPSCNSALSQCSRNSVCQPASSNLPASCHSTTNVCLLSTGNSATLFYQPHLLAILGGHHYLSVPCKIGRNHHCTHKNTLCLTSV